tara:strand:- start:588 stop:848 length:261 start_codon:yes stop_codon:yes gene_type:complete
MTDNDINCYIKAECELCESLLKLLQFHWPKIFEVIKWIDIDTNLVAFRKHGKFIPVIEINGQVVLHGEIDPKKVQKYFGPPSNPLY